VFGGTGFLGRRIVGHLRDRGFPVRIAARHPVRNRSDDPQIEPFRADIEDESSLPAAVAGMGGVVNAVSLYLERGPHTFHSVHLRAAVNLAAEARRAGVRRFVHVSGVGADPASSSPYIRSRGEGELAVQAVFPDATIVRPTVMFGPDDAFLNTMLMLLKRLPAFPIFGSGHTRLQPASVEDVAEAIVRALGREPAVYELGGPRIYDYQQLTETIARQGGLNRFSKRSCPDALAGRKRGRVPRRSRTLRTDRICSRGGGRANADFAAGQSSAGIEGEADCDQIDADDPYSNVGPIKSR